MKLKFKLGKEMHERKALTYQFPKKSSEEPGYHLIIDGKTYTGEKREVAVTKGGKMEGYTYFMWEGVSKWIDGILPSGTKCELIDDLPKHDAAKAGVPTLPVKKTTAPAPAAIAPKGNGDASTASSSTDLTLPAPKKRGRAIPPVVPAKSSAKASAKAAKSSSKGGK